MCKYFVRRDGEQVYTEVSKTAYLLAEYQAGFVSRIPGEPATAMFHKSFPEAREVKGRFEECKDAWGQSKCPGLNQIAFDRNNRADHNTPSQRRFRDNIRYGTEK